ncbi:MAG: hypothetical protein LBQ88_11700 [Treponema sp.]|jgi:RecB family exonuclease|nr:hypothetical protein [Treponema sp.]
MTYFDAACIYQDFCVSMQYAEIFKKTREEALKETEALLKELDEKKEHYGSLFKIIATIKKANGEKLEGFE